MDRKARRQRKKAIRNIRRDMSYWGVDLQHLDDDQVESVIVNVYKYLKLSGMTVEDAANNLDHLLNKGQ